MIELHCTYIARVVTRLCNYTYHFAPIPLSFLPISLLFLCYITLISPLLLSPPHAPLQAVQEEVYIPGSFVKLSYLSTRAPGYRSLLRVLLTPGSLPHGLAKVHVATAVQGRLLQKWFPAAPNLVYVLSWNKTNVYGQQVTGLVQAQGECVCERECVCVRERESVCVRERERKAGTDSSIHLA